MTDHLYFAYGSNLDPAGMDRRCPGAVPVGPATLEGWRLAFRGVADIEPGGLCWGAVWSCTDDHLRSLDRYEGATGVVGDPDGFYRREYVVVDMDGERVEALVYVMNPTPYDNASLPTQGYLDTIHRGFLHFDLPVGALRDALAHAEARLGRKGVTQLLSDGKKRLRPVGWAPAPTQPPAPTKAPTRVRPRGSMLPLSCSRIDGSLL